jgi:hypothetical protein
LSSSIQPGSLDTLAIGSVPFTETDEALNLSAGLNIPASPQMVKVSPFEDMLLGAIDGFPALLVDEENRTITIKQKGREEALADFYEKYLVENYDFLALGPRASIGFSAFLKKAAANKDFGPNFLKSQLVGPLTFGQSVKVEGGSRLVDDPELLEIISLALGGKAAWMASKIRELGRRPIIFMDEPGLTGFGSAFSTLSRETVISVLGGAIKVAKSKGDVLMGCHVCGNTDWGLLTEIGLDIINFDAYDHLEAFVLYPKEIRAFLENGGYLAWGIVPTSDFNNEIKAGDLAKKLIDSWLILSKKGINISLIKERALITSACGLGSLSSEVARGIFNILPKVSRELV